MERFDIVIVGAGLAGLTAATHAQRAGARVVVLDGRPPGGRARTDDVQGFRFNLGPHALYRSGAAARTLAGLGVEIRGHAPSADVFGLRGDRIARLPGTARQLVTSPLVGGKGKVALARLLGALPRLAPADLAGVTVRDWLEQQRMPADAADLVLTLVRVSTYAHDPDRMSADVAVAQMQLALATGVIYLDGGWQTLVDQLAAGLDVRRRQVLRVEAGADQVTAHTPDAEFVAGAAIVAVGTPHAAAAILDRPPFECGPTIEASCLDLGVAGPADPPLLFGVDRPLYLSAHSPSVVHVARYLGADEPLPPAAQRAELEAHAARAGLGPDRVLAARYLHRMVVSGCLPTAEQGGVPGRPDVTASGMPRVLLAGDWVGPEGHLADASVASATRAATLSARWCDARV